MWTLAIDHEAQYPRRTLNRYCRHPSGHIYRWFDHYLPSKQRVQTGFDLISREPKNHSLALTASIKGQHQPRLIARAPETRHSETERSVPAQNRRHTAFGIFAGGFP